MFDMNAGELSGSGIRVLFYGMPAGASSGVLGRLIEGGVDIAAVVVASESVPHLLPGNGQAASCLEPHVTDRLRLTSGSEPSDTLAVAWERGIPVLAIDNFRHPDALAALVDTSADVACVACFSRRIPAVVLRLTRYGFLNIHPSLLPNYRGPYPLFWMLRAGGGPFGVTVHYMDDGLDTGDIAAQQVVTLPEPIVESGAESQLMLAGAEMLLEVLHDLNRGIVHRKAQPPGGSYFGFPRREDFRLSTDWPAARAFMFMRGTSERSVPYRVFAGGESLFLDTAAGFDAGALLDRPVRKEGHEVFIQFNPGVLHARTAG
ncbi:MAG TPA: formyltransferase family protein [Promineifilum sp.]